MKSELHDKCQQNLVNFTASIQREGQCVIDEMSAQMIENSQRGYNKVIYPRDANETHVVMIRHITRFFKACGFKCTYDKHRFILSL